MTVMLRFAMRRLSTVMRGGPASPDEAPGVLNPAVARATDGSLYLFPRVVAAGTYSPIGIARVLFETHADPVGIQRLGDTLEPHQSYDWSDAVTRVIGQPGKCQCPSAGRTAFCSALRPPSHRRMIGPGGRAALQTTLLVRHRVRRAI